MFLEKGMLEEVKRVLALSNFFGAGGRVGGGEGSQNLNADLQVVQWFQ